MQEIPFPEFFAHLNKIAPIPEGEWTHFAQQVRRKRLGKGELLLRAGESSDLVVYVEQGLLRFGANLPDGTAYVPLFCAEDDIGCPVTSAITSSPSTIDIEAIEESIVLCFTYSLFHALYERHVCWPEIGRRLLERCLLERSQRSHELLAFDASQRYEFFRQRFARLEGRLTQVNIAAYLGISPVSLSRIIRDRRR